MKSYGFAPFFLFAVALVTITSVECNSEGDALNALRAALNDPNNVLESWDPTLVNPCTWFHVTCNGANSVVRVDLGNAGLSGHLVPQVGILYNLQYMQLEKNNISGRIPRAFGNLTNLVSLGLSHNQLSGPIPSTLGNLRSLRFMNLDSNMLTGSIPNQVIQLIQLGNLQTLNVSNNLLSGTKHHANSSVPVIIMLSLVL